MSVIFNDGKFQAVGTDGKVVPYGKLYFYEATTLNPINTYTTSKKDATNTHPIILTDSGKADVFLDAGTYDVVLKDKNDLVLWTIENFQPSNYFDKTGSILNSDSIEEAIKEVSDLLIPNVENIDALLLLDDTYTTANVRGYNTPSDNGGGVFNYDSTADKSTANGGTIIDPNETLENQGAGNGLGCWRRQYVGDINPKWFGAYGDRTNDDTKILDSVLNSNNKTDGVNAVYKHTALSLTDLDATNFKFLTSSMGNNISVTSQNKIKLTDSSISRTPLNTSDSGHLIVMPDQDNAYINNLDIETISGTGSALIFYSSDGLNKIENVTLENINVTGDIAKSTNTNGVLVEAGDKCIIDKIRAKGIHDFAVEYKNETRHSLISNIIVENSNQGIGYGQTTTTHNDVSFTSVSNAVLKDCDIGLILGDAKNNLITNININRVTSPDVNTTSTGVRFSGESSKNTLTNIGISGDVSEPIRYGADSTNNFVSATLDTAGNSVIFENGTTRNVTEIIHPINNDRIIGLENNITQAETNPIYCHATGEYNGIIGNYWHWKKNDVGLVTPSSFCKWAYESKGDSFMQIIGDDSSSLGFSVKTPTRTANIGYSVGNYWSITTNTGIGVRMYDTTLRPTSDNSIDLGNSANRWKKVYAGDGVILNSPDGSEWKLVVANDGTLSTVAQ